MKTSLTVISAWSDVLSYGGSYAYDYSIAEHAILKAISSEDRLIFKHIKINALIIKDVYFIYCDVLVHLQQQLTAKFLIGCFVDGDDQHATRLSVL